MNTRYIFVVSQLERFSGRLSYDIQEFLENFGMNSRWNHRRLSIKTPEGVPTGTKDIFIERNLDDGFSEKL